jgi:hypothetical protein
VLKPYKKDVIQLTKSVIVTARIPVELKKKIEYLNINVTEVVREALMKAVEKQEKISDPTKMEWKTIGGLGGPPSPPFPEELKGLDLDKIRELHRGNRLSPEARRFWDKYEEDLKEFLEGLEREEGTRA